MSFVEYTKDASETLDSSIKLDELGPMVVNTDGTLSRISNWKLMTESEQQNILRVLNKRNQTRLSLLNKPNP